MRLQCSVGFRAAHAFFSVFAVFLGILEMPIEEAQEEFINLYKFVFEKDSDDRATRSSKLEIFLKDLLVRKGHDADMLLEQARNEDTTCDVYAPVCLC
jgi:hypothetical protein